MDESFYLALLDDDADLLYDRAPCGYLSTTPAGEIVKVNATFLAMTGFDRKDVLWQRRFVDLLTPGGRIYHETHYAPLLHMSGSAREIALDLVRADGTRLPVLVNSVLERSPEGTPVIVRTAVFDATERRHYERELLEAKRRAEESEARAVALARTLQQTLIPPAAPQVPGLEVAAAYRPAGSGAEVGGDFYDIFEIHDGEWVAVIGDVCGKGVDAAVVTARARYTLRAAAVQDRSPAANLQTLNEVLLRSGADRFCTVCLLRLRRTGTGWTVRLSSGGHPLPQLCRAGRPPESLGGPGSLVGVLDDPVFHDEQTTLAPGDLLVLYTDGVTEGRKGAELYEEGRVREVLRTHAGASAGEVVASLLADVLDFQGGDPRDDIAIVGLRVPR